MIKPVYIIASSGHAKVIIDIFEKSKGYEIVGLIDGSRTRGSLFLGYEVVGSRDDLQGLLSKKPAELFVAIGDNWLRKRVVDDVSEKAPDAIFATAVHPSAQIGRGVNIEKGVAVMAGVTINTDSQIGSFAIINTQSSVDHDCTVGSFASMGPGAVLGGNVHIGDYSAVALGAMVKHGVHVGNHAVIGAGSMLLRDCHDQRVMYGVPARDIRSREIGEAYL